MASAMAHTIAMPVLSADWQWERLTVGLVIVAIPLGHYTELEQCRFQAKAFIRREHREDLRRLQRES